MATITELSSGDQIVTAFGMSAVFITRMPHPDHPGLMLVVWRLDEDLGGGWSFDALLPHQEVGDITPSTLRDRARRLEAALRGDPL